MSRASIATLFASATCVLLAVGCASKMTVEEMKAMIPERPPELDRLNAFVGKWESSGTARMAMLEEPLEAQGTSEAVWSEDGWYVIDKGSYSMAGLGEMSGLWTWTYDSKARVYRFAGVDSMGTVNMGEGSYDGMTGTWQMKGKSRGPMGSSTMKVWVRFIDDDTAEWGMTEYSGLTKVMEMDGSMRRRR